MVYDSPLALKDIVLDEVENKTQEKINENLSQTNFKEIDRDKEDKEDDTILDPPQLKRESKSQYVDNKDYTSEDSKPSPPQPNNGRHPKKKTKSSN